jgi:biotin operon repressor
MRTDDLLQQLRKVGEKGLTSKEMSKFLGLKLRGSSNKIVNQLRREGYNIVQKDKNHPYVLKEENSKKIENSDIVHESAEDEEIKENKNIPKKELILKLLKNNINKKVSKKVIASCATISEKTVSYHIHTLRANGEYNIYCTNGYYILTNKKKYNKHIENKPIPQEEQHSEEQEIEKALNDKYLFEGIRLMPPDCLQNYLDLIQKIIYYRKCARALLDTNKMLKRIGDGL